MKLRPLILLAAVSAAAANPASTRSIALQKIWEVDLGQPLGQLRAVPVNLGPGQPRGILAVYAQDAEIDPYIKMFFFPKSTCQMRLLTETGQTLWQRDLGPGVVPGIWYLAFFPFDLNGDGVDEIYYVGNSDPKHPLDISSYTVEQVDARTGKTTASRPWPAQLYRRGGETVYRNFIFGGYAGKDPVLVVAEGTYYNMCLQGWNKDLSLRWETYIAKDAPGARGSHMCAIADLDDNGVDEVMWGERCIEFDRGREAFCADRDTWSAHSDIVQPVRDWKHNTWQIHTCREQQQPVPPRVVSYDARGNRVWAAVDQGHMDTGWAANLGFDEPTVLAVRVGGKVRSADGEHRKKVEEFTFDAFSGKPRPLGFNVYTTIPIDLNGDGIHELVRGYFEGNGDVLDAAGRKLGNVGGLTAMCSKFTNLPGEQILSFSPDGKLRLWADRNAVDSPAALRRYAHPFYQANQRLTGCGYNLFNLGGI